MQSPKTNVWKRIGDHSLEEMVKALEFYQSHPDGQWDWLAALCIEAVMHQRYLDGRAAIRWLEDGWPDLGK